MKTPDHAYLAANPAGDEQAHLALRHDVPPTIDVPDNPDGSRPKITVAATGNTYAEALTALAGIHNDLGAYGLMALLLEQVVEADKLEGYSSIKEAAPVLQAYIDEVVVPFRTFEMTAQVRSDEPGAIPSPVEIAVTAPTIGSAIEATMSATDERVLTNVALSLSPDTDDEDSSDGDS